MKTILFILLIFSASVLAEDTTPKVWGYGTKSCTSYIATYKAWEAGMQDQVWEYFRYRDWLTGFISALTLATGSDVMRGVDPKSAMRRINLYCEENLGKDFFSATLEFIRIVGTDRQKGADVDADGSN